MRVLDPGHRYELQDLKTDSTTEIYFYKDPDINGDGHTGSSCQEYLRALINRVQFLDRQKPSDFNAVILHHLRMAIAGFESRAMFNSVTKGLAIEQLPINARGHIL